MVLSVLPCITSDRSRCRQKVIAQLYRLRKGSLEVRWWPTTSKPKPPHPLCGPLQAAIPRGFERDLPFVVELPAYACHSDSERQWFLLLTLRGCHWAPLLPVHCLLPRVQPHSGSQRPCKPPVRERWIAPMAPFQCSSFPESKIGKPWTELWLLFLTTQGHWGQMNSPKLSQLAKNKNKNTSPLSAR